MTTDLAGLARAALIEELEGLRDAVRQLADRLSEAEFWAKPVEPGNSVGHLILHLTGNLNHFVGAQLGKTGYVRDREREFTEANLPARAELLRNFDAAVNRFCVPVNEIAAGVKILGYTGALASSGKNE